MQPFLDEELENGAEEDAMPGSEADASLLAGGNNGVILGHFAGFNDDGHALVRLPGQENPETALSLVPLQAQDAGRQVALTYTNGKDRAWLILGGIHAAHQPSRTKVIVDGETLLLSADRNIELRCGSASILLTKDGKITIKGARIMSRAAGANKIKGASVQIN